MQKSDPKTFAEHVANGHELRQRGDHAGSLAAFSSAREVLPNHLGILLEITKTLCNMQRFEEAEKIACEATALHPKAASPHIELALIYRRSKKHVAAVAALKAATEADPSHLGAQLELARELELSGEIIESERLLESACSRYSSKPEPYLALGGLKRRNGPHSAALAAFENAFAADPKHLGANIELATELRDLGRFEEAEKLLRDFLVGHPHSATAWVSLGLLARRREAFDVALDAFSVAASITPLNVATQIERASELMRSGRGIEARDLLIAVSTFHRTSAAPLKALADIRRREGNIVGAIETLRLAAALEPNDIQLNISMANCLSELRRHSEADAILTNLLQKNPEDCSVLAAIGHLRRRQGRRDESLQLFQKSAELEQNNLYLKIEYSNELRDFGRLSEAASILTDISQKHPSEAPPLVALAQLERRRGNGQLALTLLKTASDLAPKNRQIRLEIVAENREIGNFSEAQELLSQLLGEFPLQTDVVMQQVQLLRRQDRRKESLELLQRLQEARPSAIIFHEMAMDNMALGNAEHALALIDKAKALDPEHLPTLIQETQMAMQSDDWTRAEEICRKSTSSYPGASAPRLQMARIQFELGFREHAFALLDLARRQLGHLPEINIREIELLRLLRDWNGIRRVVEREKLAGRANLQLVIQKIQADISTGYIDEARAAILAASPELLTEQAKLLHFLGLTYEVEKSYDAAKQHYCNCIELNKSDPSVRFDLARLSLLMLDVATCQEQLTAFTELTRSTRLLRGESSKNSQNFIGQLLDEYRLDEMALNKLIRYKDQAHAGHFGCLKRVVADHPDYTPAALAALCALTGSGVLDGSCDPAFDDRESRRIPRRIVQYWDEDPPEDVVELMQTWRSVNPDYAWLSFSDESAMRFLEESYPEEVARAYVLAHEPARKADVFRLAWLAKEGGVYVDADDGCNTGLDEMIPNGAGFVGYQEDYGSLGNNFIAAAPDHPVIRRALKLAVDALNRGDRDLVWLSTGPGLLSRAFAQHWADSDDDSWLRACRIMSLGEMQRHVRLHCHVRYKSTEKHWSKTSFARTRKTGARKLADLQEGTKA
ncbi:tetratricopeptide repeat protein [Bradyrhizobium sp. HKCCYLS2038]|uniref:tetratricopeptide repeat protein n=1 Tax=unclassified Bradyrhizobium TaxID=2631580 RepID=UPI003EC0EC41